MAESHNVPSVQLEPTHFGPVYGRPHGESLALCRPALLPGKGNTMSRCLQFVNCRHCLLLIERHIDTGPGEWMVA